MMTDEVNADFESLNADNGSIESRADMHSHFDGNKQPEPTLSDIESNSQEQHMDLYWSNEDKKEERAIERMFGSVCCSLGPKKAACWVQYDRKAVIHARQQSLELAKDELHLVILGNIQAGKSSSHLFPTHPHSPTANSRRTAFITAMVVSVFSFVYAIGHSRLENLDQLALENLINH